MSELPEGMPDLSRCFGHYRQQTPQYALTVCLRCPKLKACVRTAWGVDVPRRSARYDWWESTKKARARRRSSPPGANDYLSAT